MKIQQRNFVVEIKSAGRRSVAREGSIWGNTDLKAFIRQAESDAPQLFKQAQEPDTISRDVANLPDGAGALAAQSDEGPVTDAALLVAAPILNESLKSGGANAISNPQLAPESSTANEVTPKRKKRIENKAHRTSGASVLTTIAIPARDPIDELVALEAENRRLKALLVKHIRQQNLQLQDMLDRFNVS